MKIDKYDVALGNAAAQDDSRPALTQICFKDGTLAATNGFMLVCRKADIEDGDGFDGEVLIPAKMVKNIKSTPKKPAKMTVKDKAITATYYDKSGMEVDPKLQFKADLDATFPDASQLFPKGKKHYQCALGIGLLRQLLACLPKDGTLRLGFLEGGGMPMEFKVSGNVPADYDSDRPIYGMILPMFVQWDGDEWQKARERPN